MLHDLACNQFRFTSPILLQMGVFLCSSADDISYTIKKEGTVSFIPINISIASENDMPLIFVR